MSVSETVRPSVSYWKEALAPLKELEQQWVGQWDSTDIIRYYRETMHPSSRWQLN